MRRKLGLALVVAAVVVGPWASRARADFTVYDDMHETLMEAQANQGLFIGFLFGPDDGAVIHLTANLDTSTGEFSYITDPGNTYLGEAIALNMSGVYDAVTRIATWTTSGSLGAVSWSTEGSAEWEGDPKGKIEEKTNLGGDQYTVKGDIEYTVDPKTGKGTSTGKYTFTGPPGGPFAGPFGPYDGTDSFGGPGERWRHRVTVPVNPVTPGGLVEFSSGAFLAGNGAAAPATLQITSVPEPSALAMAGLAAATLLGVARLRARRSA